MPAKVLPPPVPPELTTLAIEVSDRANEIKCFLLGGHSLSADLLSDLSVALGDARDALEECDDFIADQTPPLPEWDKETRAKMKGDWTRDDFDEGEVVEWSAGDGDEGE